MIYSEQEMLNALEKSFEAYKEKGARSTAKLIPLHSYIAKVLGTIWGDQYAICSMGVDNNKECKVTGRYYLKDIDITVVDKKNAPVFCVGVKFITSNYKQNANNYFEGMMGETANIQANQIPYAHLIFMRHQTPYYTKNDSENPSKIEVVNEKDLSKYIKLMFDVPQAHKPIQIGLFLMDIDERSCTIRRTKLNQYFTKEVTTILTSKFSLDQFFKEISLYSIANR